MTQEQTPKENSFQNNQKLLQEALQAYLDTPSTLPSYFETMEAIDRWLKKEQQQ